MAQEVYFIILLTVIYLVQCQYFQWNTSSNSTRNSFCSEDCRDCSVTPCVTEELCCVCKLKSGWEVGQENITPLHIEYRNVLGDSTLVNPFPSQDKSSIFEVIHTNGRLRKFPSNYCSHERILHVDFQFNKIEKVPDLSCTPYLEILILNNNALSEIRNTTFNKNTYLRKLDLSFNPIRLMDANTFKRYDGSIPYSMNLASTRIKDLDVTNFLFEGGTFCELDFSSSTIQNFVNGNNFTVSPGVKYGTNALVNFENTRITQLPNMTSFGIKSGYEFYKHLDFKVLTTNLSFTCDCIYARYLTEDFPVIKTFFIQMELDTLICSEPESLRNFTLAEIKENLLDDMTCDVGYKCPHKCHCFEQPSRNHTVINCTNADITKLPDILPWASNYSLFFGDNDIPSLEEKSYFGKVSYMQISGLKEIDSNTVKAFPEGIALDVKNHHIQKLPKELMSKNSSRINFGQVQIDCVCSDKWLYLWIQSTNNQPSTEYICSNLNKNLSNLTIDDFQCEEPVNEVLFTMMITLSVLAVLLILSTLSYSCWYPEMLILARKCFTKTRPHEKKCDFDVYISLDEKDHIQRNWVIKCLLPFLESEGYIVYLPMRDSLPGEIEISSRMNAIKSSIASIVILTEKESMENFRDIDDTIEISVIKEFELMWRLFVKQQYRNIIVLNFENIRKQFTGHRIVKAFVRTRHFVKVSSRKRNVLKEVRSRLHEPRAGDSMLNTMKNVSDFNRNIRFHKP
ncbi:protein toll-like [Ostrea edulis]|uniref:protein toll-like n=1 Tax=Ostrea edulis TaxID=37623 RepID=UPI002095BCAF|nr:protein toll-like [Ostrea edulis]